MGKSRTFKYPLNAKRSQWGYKSTDVMLLSPCSHFLLQTDMATDCQRSVIMVCCDSS